MKRFERFGIRLIGSVFGLVVIYLFIVNAFQYYHLNKEYASYKVNQSSKMRQQAKKKRDMVVLRDRINQQKKIIDYSDLTSKAYSTSISLDDFLYDLTSISSPDISFGVLRIRNKKVTMSGTSSSLNGNYSFYMFLQQLETFPYLGRIHYTLGLGGDWICRHFQLKCFGKIMGNFSILIQNSWFRLIVLTSSAIFGGFLISVGLQFFLIEPLELDLRDAKRGISRFEKELSRLESEVTAIEKKIQEKSKVSQGRYQHYYTLYSNPVRYINQFVLNQAKPEQLLVTSSSVMPNTSLTSIERTQLNPHIKEYGISRIKNLTKLFSVTRVSLVATGSFLILVNTCQI